MNRKPATCEVCEQPTKVMNFKWECPSCESQRVKLMTKSILKQYRPDREAVIMALREVYA